MSNLKRIKVGNLTLVVGAKPPGKGISSKDLIKLFKKFRKSNQKTMKKYFTMAEAANSFNIDTRSFRKLLSRHPDIKDQYVSKRRCEGDIRTKMYISREGMVVLGNVKNVKGVTMTPLTKGKKMLAEKAMQKVMFIQETSDDIYELKQMMITLQKEIRELKGDTEHSLPMIAEKPREITTRAKINQMVRRYAKENLIPHNLVWGKLYTQLYYRYQYNAQIRSKNSGMPCLDCVYNDGQMDNLFKIAFDILN